MITIITALYSEAKPFLEYLTLKKNTSLQQLTLFEGENIRLLITGVGEIAACMTVTRYFTLFPPAKTDIAANIGLAGCLLPSGTKNLPALGSCYLAAKLTESSTERTFYPDLLYQNSFAKAELRTVPAIAKKSADSITQTFSASCSAMPSNSAASAVPSSSVVSAATPPLPLVDMEAAGIYQAALPFLSTERMFFFKTISDYGVSPGQPPIAPDVLIAPHVCSILAFLNEVQTAVSTEPSNCPPAFSSKEQAAIDRLLRQLPMTAFLQQELLRQLRYYKLCGNSADDLLAAFLDSLPSVSLHGKKQGKTYFDRLTEQILAGTSKLSARPAEPETSYLPCFSNLYIEEELWEKRGQLIPKQLLARTNSAEREASAPITVIPIQHYKDVFNRSRQSLAVQKHAPSLILASNHGTLLYPGAPVCQSFGNRHFYYASNLMNCIYHCDYCYLQGMYPSGHMVAFCNLTDYFAEVAAVLKQHPVYLCISYDTDLLALEPLFHFTEQWMRFAKHHPDLTLEIRTKSGNPKLFSMLRNAWDSEAEEKSSSGPANLVFAWTISPEELSLATEHGAAPLSARLKALKAAKCAGFSVRLCFDPMIYFPGWQEAYQKLVYQVFEQPASKLFPEELLDASIGVFRISTEYLKAMRKKRPDSPIVQFPYVTESGISHYGSLSEKMVQYLYKLLLPYLPPERIFVWDGKENEQPQENGQLQKECKKQKKDEPQKGEQPQP